MPNPDSSTQTTCSWADDARVIGKTFRLSTRWPRLLVALAGLGLILLWGGLLDKIWVGLDRGVGPDSLAAHLAGGAGDESDGDPTWGTSGVFAVWRQHQMDCMDRAASAVCHGRVFGGFGPPPPSLAFGADSLLDMPASLFERSLASAGVLRLIGYMGSGVAWMFTERPCFATIFWLGTIALMSLIGGGLCRQMTLDLARDEQPTIRQTFEFVRSKYWGGFLAAPLLPAGILLGLVLVMGALGFLMLRIPVLGDVLGGLFFAGFLLLGFLAALIGLGTLLSGGLFWPVIAAEGTDAFDAVSRSFPYVFGRPWKALVYATVMIGYGAVCWMAVRILAFVLLWVAHTGVTLFGSQGTILANGFAGAEGLWSAPTLALFYPSGMATDGFFEAFSAGAVKLWVLLIIGLVWAFPLSFFLAANTVVYALLRRDVDSTDLDEVYIEGYEETPFGGESTVPAATAGTESASSKSLNILNPDDAAGLTEAPATGASPAADAESPSQGDSDKGTKS
ncbi:MAG: hypothetical protein IID37_01155 [Planctomycetes bacterium]|nr:hypothetical protein [Planctomycetota bacterium]